MTAVELALLGLALPLICLLGYSLARLADCVLGEPESPEDADG